jgi:hypothetical protein
MELDIFLSNDDFNCLIKFVPERFLEGKNPPVVFSNSGGYALTMTVVIEMPLGHYDRFMNKCGERSSPAFLILKNGIMIRRANEGRFLRTMQIRCGVDQARHLLELAVLLYPDVVQHIQNAVIFSGDL